VVIALGPRVLAPADKADVTPDVWLIEFPADAIELLRGGKANVFGADAGLIAAIAGGYPDAKAVPGTFSIVRAAIALPKGRSSAAEAKLLELVNEAKKTGVVQNAFEQAGLKTGVSVAPQ